MSMQPRVTDNDNGEIHVSLNEKFLRGWSYQTDDERRQKMLLAREYVEGWCDSVHPMTAARDSGFEDDNYPAILAIHEAIRQARGGA